MQPLLLRFLEIHQQTSYAIFQIKILEHLENNWYLIYWQQICKNILRWWKNLNLGLNNMEMIQKTYLCFVEWSLILRISMVLLENGLRVNYGVRRSIRSTEHSMKMRERRGILNSHSWRTWTKYKLISYYLVTCNVKEWNGIYKGYCKTIILSNECVWKGSILNLCK